MMQEPMAAPAPSIPSLPEISVVIPVYGRRAGLRRCVESALRQAPIAIEILLIDDGSPDDPFAALGELRHDPRLRLHRLDRNRGVSGARNAGISLARGRYVAFLDSDDEWETDKLREQWLAAERAGHPTLFFALSQSHRLLPGNRRDIRPDRFLRPGERAGDYIYVHGAMAQTSSFFVSRALALAHPFREELRQFEDHLFFIEAIEAGAETAFVPRPLSTYHDDTTEGRLSSAKSLAQCDLYEELARPLLSQRARLAFRARYRARLLFDDDRAGALALAARATAAGAMRPRFIAGFLLAWLRSFRPAR